MRSKAARSAGVALPALMPLIAVKRVPRAAGMLRSSWSALKDASKIPEAGSAGRSPAAALRSSEKRLSVPSALSAAWIESSVKLSCLRGWPARRV